MVVYFRRGFRRLKPGVQINAPGAPIGYAYGETILCPKCGHKSIVFRPRRKMWVCTYENPLNYVPCGYETFVYTGVRNGGVPSPRRHVAPVDTRQCEELIVEALPYLEEGDVSAICGSREMPRPSVGARQYGRGLAPSAGKRYRQKYKAASN